MSDKIPIVINVNNQDVALNAESRLLLVDLLRNNLELKGTHIGCDTSQCGSCMVMIDGKCIKSCSILTVQCNKKSIKTIESIGKENNLSNVQKAFHENHGLQCGFCTPGFIMTAIECKKNNISTEEEIREFLDGNFCRCTGYQNIVKSIISFLKMP
jgi:carbon-monoxide dehydrogenase small subunit